MGFIFGSGSKNGADLIKKKKGKGEKRKKGRRKGRKKGEKRRKKEERKGRKKEKKKSERPRGVEIDPQTLTVFGGLR